MKIKTRKWDTSEHLDSPEMIHEYLKAAFEEGDDDQMLVAIGNVAKAYPIRNATLRPDWSTISSNKQG